MVDGAASKAPASPRESGWWVAFTNPTIAAILVYGAVAIVAAVAAYLALFTQFTPYDDEGTLLITLKAFAHGDTLYRDVYSEYGPFFYEVFGGLFALTGRAVTTDASRSIVVCVWVATSLLFGVTAQRLTGRLALGVVGMVAAFAALHVLAREPMHPHGLSVLLIGVFVLLAVNGPGRRVAWAGAASGALLAALTLTKINLGVFAVAAVVLAAVWTVGPLYRMRWLRWPVALAYLAMPLLITARDLSSGWTAELATLEVLAITALFVAAWPLRPDSDEVEAPFAKWLLAAAAGFAAAFVAILAIILLTGPTPADVYDGLITQALRVRDVLVTRFPSPPSALDWALAAVAASVLTMRWRAAGGTGPSLWSGMLRLAAGLLILCAVAGIVPVALNPSAGNPLTVPMLLAWVAAVPPAAVTETDFKRFLRVLLPALAIAETLQVYPVAGSQMGIAALVFVPVGALCLGDALICLRAWSVAQGGQALARFGVAVTVGTVGLATVFALEGVLRPAASSAVAYRDQQALPFPGAGALRLPPEEVATYAGVVDLIHKHRCTAFFGYPNIDSFYLWAGLDAPPPQAPGAWIEALDGSEQQRVVNELRASPRPCVIRSETRSQYWLAGGLPPDRPLVRYLFDDFVPVAQVGDFEFALPKEPAADGTPGTDTPHSVR